MLVSRVSDAAEFLERAGPLLAGDEARHNLILGIAGTLRDRPEVYPEFGLWVVEAAGSPVAAALMTPPHNLVLADAVDPAALARLAQAVREAGLPVPGVVGGRPTVDEFNEIWAALAGVTPRLHMAQGIFALEAVRPVPLSAGAARVAGPGDAAWLLGWLEAFTAEAVPEEPFVRERTQRGLTRVCDPAVVDAGIWLWEDGGEAVSMAAFGSPIPGGVRIGPVYTPPERRCRGYGTGVVWALSSWLLRHGRRRCFLYTDLANPTSNAIYRRIGYKQVGESAEYGFEAGG
jgi:predicted GNAT family acetyltransferase